ncbi:hypothetical protein VTI74DRAFT_8724 [Chaetomium olivicolor]
MSRALDAKTAASLKEGNTEAAYQAISKVLVSPLASDDLLDIEILGQDYFSKESPYVLQDDDSVVVSKPGLVLAFMAARQRLQSHLNSVKLQSDDEMFAATAVILLFDPEYLTAANTRKRLIQGQLSKGFDANEVLRREQHLVDSLLTARLHRHTKSPTLWSHRRWLVSMSTSFGLPVDVSSDLKNVVFVAGQRHPRNYYAWCHARFLVSLNGSIVPPDMLAAVRKWSFDHHTDISGWSFLSFLLESHHSRDTGVQNKTFSEVLDLVAALRLANESVWVFLRTLAASRLVGEEQYTRFLAVQKTILEASTKPTDQAVLRAAVDWCETYRTQDWTQLTGS